MAVALTHPGGDTGPDRPAVRVTSRLEPQRWTALASIEMGRRRGAARHVLRGPARAQAASWWTPRVRRYRSSDEDSARWEGFTFRHGDIVISTRTKHGTTWMQMICLLLVHRDPELPAPLAELSPWLDWRIEDFGEVMARLDRQVGRRVLKTHTPLDGVPLNELATYVVVARHPLDAAVSLRHQGDNLDRQRMAELSGEAMPASATGTGRRGPVDEWLGHWIRDEADPFEQLDSLDGVFHHLTDAWSRRDEANVVLVHYQDLIDDLMRR
jgi:aryl sulfotransferase